MSKKWLKHTKLHAKSHQFLDNTIGRAFGKELASMGKEWGITVC